MNIKLKIQNILYIHIMRSLYRKKYQSELIHRLTGKDIFNWFIYQIHKVKKYLQINCSLKTIFEY